MHCKSSLGGLSTLNAHVTFLQRCLNVPSEKAANFRNFPGVKENVPKGTSCKGTSTHYLRTDLLSFEGDVLCLPRVSPEYASSSFQGNLVLFVTLCLGGLLCMCAQQLRIIVYVQHCSPKAHPPASCSLDTAVVDSSLSCLESVHLLLSNHKLVLTCVWRVHLWKWHTHAGQDCTHCPAATHCCLCML